MASVRILGAGLSGLATALLLARRGFEVEVRDRRLAEGGRFTGGFQVLENGASALDALAELEALGLEPCCELTPMREAVLLDSSLERFAVRSQQPYAYLLRRGPGNGTLDAWLRAEAAAAGVRLVEGTADRDWRPEVVATGPGGADGAARERLFRTDHPDLVAVLLDPTLTPTGYAYLFVRDGWGTLGAAQVRLLDRLRANAEAAFARLDEAFPMAKEVVGEKVLWMSFGLPRHLVADGVWYVGESAGVQDFLFGLGNRLALRSAALVASAVAGEGWDGRAFRRQLVAPMEASVLARALYELAGAGGLSRLCRWLAGGDFRERLLALQRPTRWRRLLARVVMAAWGSRGARAELPVARWRRRRPWTGAGRVRGEVPR